MTTAWFNESPERPERVKFTTVAGRYSNTGGIDTTAIDQYRQGVEISLPAHSNAGIVKFGTGEFGNLLKQSTFGMGVDTVDRTAAFVESETDTRGDGPWSTDGAIEVFAIRSIITHKVHYNASNEHGVRGALMAGTECEFGSSAQIVDVYKFSSNTNLYPFVDVADAMGGIQLQRVSTPISVLVDAVDDTVEKSGIQVPIDADTEIANALRIMTPSSDLGLVPNAYISAVAGFTYDSQYSIGTDSIAFGGLEH